jgi:hypothetical protein
MKTKNKKIEKIIREISENRYKILDDFAKVYLADRWNYFKKQKEIDFRRLELVEQRKSPTETIYFFRLRKGKLPK